MAILLGFLLPLLLFMAMMILFGGRKDQSRRPLIGAFLLVGIWTTLAVYHVYWRSGGWQNATEIAWVGVGTGAQGKDLRIGGDDPASRCGWPREGFSPDVRIIPKGDASVQLTIRGGGGFLMVPQGDIPGVTGGGALILGAEEMNPDDPKTVDGRQVMYRESGLVWRDKVLEIALPELNGVEITGALLRSLEGDATAVRRGKGWVLSVKGLKGNATDTSVSLQGAIRRQIILLRSLGGKVAEAARGLEAWSGNVQYYRTDNNPRWVPRWIPFPWFKRTTVWLQGRLTAGSTNVRIPSGDLTLVKPGRKVRFRLVPGSRGGVDAFFQPPWRVVSPLPPKDPRWQDPTGGIRLTFAADPQLDEASFIIPLSGVLEESRFERTLASTTSDSMVFREYGTEPPKGGDENSKEAVPASLGWSGITSSTWLDAGETSFVFATVNDLPKRWRVILGMVLALSVPLAGLMVLVPSPLGAWRNSMWMTAGILASAWAMLSLRLLLALRYSLHPSTLDPSAVKGVGYAFAALPLAMTAILVIAGSRFAEGLKLRRDEIFKGLGWIAIAGGVLAWVEYYLGAGLWSNMPGYYRAFPSGWIGIVVFVVTPVGLLSWVFCSYSERRGKFVYLAHWFEHMCTKVGPELWIRSDETRIAWRSFLWIMILLLLVVGILGNLFGVVSTNVSAVSELLGSAVLMTLGALWLGSKSRRAREERMSPWTTVSLTLILIFALIILPFAFRDVGALYGTLGILLPMCVILIASRPLRPGITATAGLVFAVVLTFAVYLNWETIDPIMDFGPLKGMAGEGRSRILTFKEGEGALGKAVTFPVIKGPEGPTAWKIQNAVQHTWANVAMVHLGGWRGTGFGQAPVRQLQIQESTLRYDSLFSSYIASEYGLVGGLSLLLLSAMPLLITLLGKPVTYRQGYAFAVLLAATYFMDGFTHAAMNMDILPFTGRNYPFLSVGSISDFLHWTFLLAIVAQVSFWGDSEGESASEKSKRGDWAPYFLLALGVLTVIGLAYRGWGLTANHGLDQFNGSSFLARVEKLIRGRAISWDDRKQNIQIHDPKVIGSLTSIGQEIHRFNALPLEEKLGMPDPELRESYRDGIRALRTPQAYDSFLRVLAAAHPLRGGEIHPPLFQLVESSQSFLEELGEGEEFPRQQYTLATNPAFNNIIVLNRPGKEKDLPTVRLARSGAPEYELRGNRFNITVPARPNDGSKYRIVRLLLQTDGSLALLKDSNPDGGKGEIHITGMRSGKSKLLLKFETETGGVRMGQGAPLVVRRGEQQVRVGSSRTALATPGDSVALDEEDSRARLIQFAVGTAKGSALVGPAWVMGNWSLATDTGLDLPFTHALRQIAQQHGTGEGKDAFERIAGTLTLDPELQRSAQRFTQERGRRLFAETLKGSGLSGGAGKRMTPNEFRRHLPPRVAVAVIAAPTGEVLALGSWPRPKSWNSWSTRKDGEEIPPLDWLEAKAPATIRSKYTVDHNFDRMLMGSSTKPIWAAGVLALHPELKEAFRVRGSDEREDAVFGIDIPGGTPWKAGWSRSADGSEWCDFNSYLSRSDNRYQVRLGFLGLAAIGHGGILTEDRGSPSLKESMNAGKSPWRRYPKFPEELRFSSRNPQVLANLDQAPLFGKLWEMFRMGYRSAPDSRSLLARHRHSFWSGDSRDDVYSTGTDFAEASNRTSEKKILQRLGGIAPETVNLALDQPPAQASGTSGQWTPREYISLLLGGGSNRWANVDFAGGFARSVVGKPVVPHITAGKMESKEDTKGLMDVSKQLRPGLMDVLRRGSAVPSLSGEARGFLGSMKGVKAYAKTGTLDQKEYKVSRIAVALINWKDASETNVDHGLVFSVVVENGNPGAATAWFGDFLLENGDAIRRHLAVR